MKKLKWSPAWDLSTIPDATWKKEADRRKKVHGYGGKRTGSGRKPIMRNCRRCGELVTGNEERFGHDGCQPHPSSKRG